MQPVNAVFGLAVLAVNGSSGLLPSPDLARRISESDVIVVARIRSGTRTSAGERTSMNCVLHIERVLKGAVIAYSDIPVAFEGRGAFVYPQASVMSAPKLYGIWFLKSEDGKYDVVPRSPGFGELEFAATWLPEEAPPGPAGRTPGESVSNELLSALRWLAAAHGDELKPVTRTETVGDRRVPSLTLGKFGSQLVGLADNLRTLPAETAYTAYRQLVEEKSPHLRSIGVAGLIGLNDPEGPRRAAAELKPLSEFADVNAIVRALSGYHNAGDAEAIRAIAHLAQADLDIPLLKESASYALRVLHTKWAMPALVALLDADESSVRANALAGICLFIRNATTVTPEAVRTMSWMSPREPTPFRTAATDQYCWLGGTPDEAARLTGHLAFWKAWWREHATEVLAAP